MKFSNRYNRKSSRWPFFRKILKQSHAVSIMIAVNPVLTGRGAKFLVNFDEIV